MAATHSHPSVAEVLPMPGISISPTNYGFATNFRNGPDGRVDGMNVYADDGYPGICLGIGSGWYFWDAMDFEGDSDKEITYGDLRTLGLLSLLANGHGHRKHRSSCRST